MKARAKRLLSCEPKETVIAWLGQAMKEGARLDSQTAARLLPGGNNMDVQGAVERVLLARRRDGHLLEVAGGDQLLPVTRCAILVPPKSEQGARQRTKMVDWNGLRRGRLPGTNAWLCGRLRGCGRCPCCFRSWSGSGDRLRCDIAALSTASGREDEARTEQATKCFHRAKAR